MEEGCKGRGMREKRYKGYGKFKIIILIRWDLQ
jgi:hypothetical protein